MIFFLRPFLDVNTDDSIDTTVPVACSLLLWHI